MGQQHLHPKFRSTTQSSFLLHCYIYVLLLNFLGCAAQLLPPEEVQTLKAIATKLEIKHWRVTRSSCGGDGGFQGGFLEKLSNVTCNCTFSNNSVCHVTNIRLNALNLTGELPSEFSKLAFLQELDLTQNYINGTIPTTFGQLRLKILGLTDNRLSGSIPPEIADIGTLEELTIEDNQMGGPLPPELGRLRSLRRLLLSANNFTGRIPESFGALKNLSDFRIDGSRLSGKIPDFIGNWTKMTILDLQGTSMEGPIPSSISLLINLQQLRISDLNGSVSRFPNLGGMTNMTYLILRNCLITDSIPKFLANMSLNTLDLSFNRLSGQIPDSLGPRLNFLYLNSNSLSGVIPSWIIDSKEKFDVSYNNFTQPPSQYRCQASSVNLVASHSSSTSNSTLWCLKKDLPCPGTANYHSLFINCGGPIVESGGREYEVDLNTEGPSFFNPTDRWAYSSSGVYIYNDRSNFVATKSNVTGEEYYQTARLSPSSLKYYGLCLQKGSYKVRLHFAEIQFSDDATFLGIGRRIFDVSIQGNVVRKDFNIAEEAGGIGKGFTLEQDVTVNGSTLEIHLYWAGKGTTAVPNRGVYGPLISAISVTPNFKTGGISSLAIAAIVVASSLVSLGLILVLLWMKGFLGGNDAEDKELRGAIEQQTGYFSLKHIKAATGNFDHANKIGEGGFGPVYKGILPDGKEIAVKQLSSKSKQGNREFINEIGMISALQHPNLVKLFGCCIEGNQLLLVYEYLENNSLARALFGRDEQRLNLDWSTRKKILLEIARGLTYLHEESRLKIVHRDIKATNVLLDRDLNAKISDFGLAKLDEEENTHISTRIAGTVGYMAPEYAMRGYLTDKADVYSFGIVALEIVSGKSNTGCMPKEEFVYLLDRAYVLQEQGKLLELVDPILGTNYSKQEALSILNVGLLCSNPSPTLRPSMSAVVSMLQGKKKVEAPVFTRTTTNESMMFKAFERYSHDSHSVSSMEGAWADSSISIPSKDTSKLLEDMYDVDVE
ncbi:LRR receptor serine/threonine-protein kinase [Heracleum sosnowskyi]|uniref:non-specific serine/threonine protein kinase n=1 Tax=Heracleum sosnowskyi TaxID=360622 RepID=A0AAD8JN27_9APIA|nr:LRR receptor serine/threonine-protein kinase [Heracleum sosnowskyi]KAK1404922.1 LRR receptor serine/threonine-protein kinase [Heracleum sosnowskyi]